MNQADIVPAFERIAREAGASYADMLVIASPPPWEEGEFYRHIDRLYDLAASPFVGKPVSYSDSFIEAMKLAAFDGFETRIKAIWLSASGLEGGHA